jgi:hypothetical protein
MITEPTLPIERKGFDLILVPNFLHVVMLAEPGWVIPAGRYERRYAAFSVSDVRRGDRGYFKELYAQINGAGAAAMMWELQRMDLDSWHPREIPESLLKGAALQQQQTLTLSHLAQWYLLLLEDGIIPGALIGATRKVERSNTAYTKELKRDALDRFPRLRYELSDNALRDFLADRDWPKAEKYRDSRNNGWSFLPLDESRRAWERRYGPREWNEMREWFARERWE